jgi:nucleoside 2-deoxyribosyltransferase
VTASVYLAGPITGLPYRGKVWRDSATPLLSPLVVVNPLLIEVDLSKPEELVAADLIAVAACDVVLVRADEPSWGTAMEIWHAHELKIPVVAWTNGVEAHRLSPWLRYCAAEFHARLPEAVDSIKERLRAHL